MNNREKLLELYDPYITFFSLYSGYKFKIKNINYNKVTSHVGIASDVLFASIIFCVKINKENIQLQLCTAGDYVNYTLHDFDDIKKNIDKHVDGLLLRIDEYLMRRVT